MDGEVNPEEVLGCALDAWKDAMFASAVHVARERKRASPESSSPTTVLLFGLRDGSLPTFLARRYPSDELECVVVENDNRVVELAEISGSDTFVHVDTPWGELVAQLTGVHYFELGAQVRLHLNPAQAYVFGADESLVLAPQRAGGR